MDHIYQQSFTNKQLGIQLTSYVDKQQKIWFLGKEVAEILGYKNTKKAILTHVDKEDKKPLFTYHFNGLKMGPWGKSGSICIYINESGFYSLILSSKLKSAKKFKHWITSEVLPSIRKYGQYKLFDSTWNETDLHYKVVQLIRNYSQMYYLFLVWVKIKIQKKKD